MTVFSYEIRAVSYETEIVSYENAADSYEIEAVSYEKSFLSHKAGAALREYSLSRARAYYTFLKIPRHYPKRRLLMKGISEHSIAAGN
jgi:hypothetical protein